MSSPGKRCICSARALTGMHGLGLRWMAAFIVGLSAGCGGASSEESIPTGDASGTITIAGKPLVEGRVNFFSAEMGLGGGGDLNPDGTYSLDGELPNGKYSVFISFDIAPAQLGTEAEDVMKTVPKKYLSSETSGLTADMNVGDNKHDFDLK